MPGIIEINHLSHIYAEGSPYEVEALKDITLSLERGEFLGLFGPNGSGKSTLIQHLNGLIRPQQGSVIVCGKDASNSRLSRDLWKKAGLVFQYPEHQIFQISVYDEVAYGPRNLKLPESAVNERVNEALQQVGLTQENITQLPPAALSGGMRRRVAVAGMLAIQPEILILDEPMAGMDSVGRNMILDIIKKRQERHETTVMVSHSLKEIMTLTDKIAILDSGSLAFSGKVKDLLGKPEILAHYHFELPEYLQIVYEIAAKGFDIKTDISSIREAGEEISKLQKIRKDADYLLPGQYNSW
ncbi:MAG: energy-coupling factor transporter ATPase [Syntrophomonadaceae bacterium]|nr:energy-coupling factor transporter ATPase [Syntrophomonadaceae bacterium]